MPWGVLAASEQQPGIVVSGAGASTKLDVGELGPAEAFGTPTKVRVNSTG
jgi:hypothetical protein